MLGGTAHFKVEGKWNDDLMTQVKPPARSPPPRPTDGRDWSWSYLSSSRPRRRCSPPRSRPRAFASPGPIRRVPATVGVAAQSFAYRPAGDFSEDGRPRRRAVAGGRSPAFEIIEIPAHGRPIRRLRRRARLPAAAGVAEPRPAFARGDVELCRTRAPMRRGSAPRPAKPGACRATPNGASPPAAAPATTRSGAPDPIPPTAGSPNTTPRARRPKSDERLRPLGAFGANENGLYDLSGNVWEWTTACFVRYAAGPQAARPVTTNCGVRVVEGEHRAYLTDFIRDARAGGCSAGKPPTHLGVRLVRETRASGLAARLRYAV